MPPLSAYQQRSLMDSWSYHCPRCRNPRRRYFLFFLISECLSSSYHVLYAFPVLFLSLSRSFSIVCSSLLSVSMSKSHFFVYIKPLFYCVVFSLKIMGPVPYLLQEYIKELRQESLLESVKTVKKCVKTVERYEIDATRKYWLSLIRLTINVLKY